MNINIHSKQLTVGAIIKIKGDLYIVTCRVFPDVCELAHVHWNKELKKYVGDRAYREIVVLPKKWVYVENLPEKECSRVFDPSEGSMIYGYRIPYYSVVDQARLVADKYERDRRHNKVDRTLLVDQER